MKTEATTAPTGLTEKQIADVREAFTYFDRLDFLKNGLVTTIAGEVSFRQGCGWRSIHI